MEREVDFAAKDSVLEGTTEIDDALVSKCLELLANVHLKDWTACRTKSVSP